MNYILQYSKTARHLCSGILDGGLALLILLLSSMLLPPAAVSQSWLGADFGMVALLSLSAVAATCAVRSGTDRALGPEKEVKGVRSAAAQGARAAAVGALLAILLGYAYGFMRHDPTGAEPTWVQISIALVPASLFLSQFLQRFMRPYAAPPPRVAVVGDPVAASRIANQRETVHPLHIVGFFELNPDNPAPSSASDLTKNYGYCLRRFLEDVKPSVVVVARPQPQQEQNAGASSLPVWDLLRAKATGCRIVDLAEFLEMQTGRIDLQSLRADSLLFGPALAGSGGYLLCKRLVDIFVALSALVLTAWLFPAIAMLVKATSRGPAIYRQERVGLNGSAFTLLKFRSMQVDAERASGPVWAMPDDPRVTPVGAFLRRTRLDELPQLWNVLRGDMSLVGPRPERAHFVEVLSRSLPFYGLRHAMKPGLTGWAQVNDGYAASVDESAGKLSYDLFYIRHSSIIFDFYIMARTLIVVLKRAGQ